MADGTTIEYGHTCPSDAGTYICWCGAGPDSPVAQFQRTVTVTYGPIEPVTAAFFEEDEPVADVGAAFERGEKGTT